MDGNEVQRAVLSIDVSDEFGDLTLQFRRICQGGRGDLDKDDLSNPLRVVLQQFFKGTQLRVGDLSGHQKKKKQREISR